MTGRVQNGTSFTKRHWGARGPRRGLVPAALLAAACAVGGLAWAQDSKPPAEFDKPTRHFQIDRPAELSDTAALTVYQRVLDEMVAGYSLSRDENAEAYRRWRRYNTTPYRSATHGQRFVNTYANMAAKAYGRYEEAGQMPAGAVIAKDSFAVTARGDVFLGPLFVMEKMPAGFNARSGDWRYTMIMPDGSLFGRTNGEGDERVEFCITCHLSVAAESDHLFFVPKANRIRFLEREPQEQ